MYQYSIGRKSTNKASPVYVCIPPCFPFLALQPNVKVRRIFSDGNLLKEGNYRGKKQLLHFQLMP